MYYKWRICVKNVLTFMAEYVARVSVHSLLFCICNNLQLHKYVCILGYYAALHNVSIYFKCEWLWFD